MTYDVCGFSHLGLDRKVMSSPIYTEPQLALPWCWRLVGAQDSGGLLRLQAPGDTGKGWLSVSVAEGRGILTETPSLLSQETAHIFTI